STLLEDAADAAERGGAGRGAVRDLEDAGTAHREEGDRADRRRGDRSRQQVELRLRGRHRALLRADREPEARVEAERPAPDAVQRREADLGVTFVAFRVLAIDQVAEDRHALPA